MIIVRTRTECLCLSTYVQFNIFKLLFCLRCCLAIFCLHIVRRNEAQIQVKINGKFKNASYSVLFVHIRLCVCGCHCGAHGWCHLNEPHSLFLLFFSSRSFFLFIIYLFHTLALFCSHADHIHNARTYIVHTRI